MEALLISSQQKVQEVSLKFERYLLSKIDWSQRLIGIKGARGSGKTTLLLQYMSKHLSKDGSALYVAMDDLFFTDKKLYHLSEEFSKNGGTHLFLDEVHKYPNWSRELKLIYDNIKDLKVVFTSSSILEIYKGESDLSRRAISYNLKELSLREYIAIDKGIHLPTFSMEEILENHVRFAKEIVSKIKPILAFKGYLKNGAYPYFIESKSFYQQRLLQTINLIIDIDLNAVEHLNYEMLVKMKKLLKAIATSVPFTPNISSLSKKIGMSRPSLVKAIQLLEKARLLYQISKKSKGIGHLTKPEKLFLNNPNLLEVLAKENSNIGTARETFFLNQIDGIKEIHLAPKGDFIVNEKYTFEIGGINKDAKQIMNTKDAYLVKDDIEYGTKNIIPLWLFGFMY